MIFKQENLRNKKIGNPGLSAGCVILDYRNALLFPIYSHLRRKKYDKKKDWPNGRFFPTKGSIQGNARRALTIQP
jgi:hypothetical protein